MDPNKTLETIRKLITKLANEDEVWTVEDTEEFSYLVEGLDEWLSRGGFLPKAWER